MANFAKINASNIVIDVVAVKNEALDSTNEGLSGSQFLTELLGGTWVQTSYNNRIRGTYAGIGYEYNAAEDIFITPKPYPSWIRSGSFWDSPIPYPNVNPDDETRYNWSEPDLAWIVNELI